MSKSQKELAFLRDLTVTADWTDRFTTLVDTHFIRPKKGAFLYVNAGTLTHALEIREKLSPKVSMVCICEDIDLRRISEAKVKAIKADIEFSALKDLKSDSFDAVMADLTLVNTGELNSLIDDLTFVAKSGADVSFFAVTAGSYGEVYSYLWETFLGIELIEKSGEIERMIAQIPTVSKFEQLAAEAGLNDVLAETGIEIFEYDSGKEFVDSTLALDFLFRRWLDFLSAKEQKQALKKLAQIIDAEHDKLTFRFTVKSAYFHGVKG